MRIFLGLAYDGKRFSGYQKGTGKNSVEDNILRCVKENKLGSHLISCSRTDRNVSALMNVVSIDSDLSPIKIIGILNSNLENIYFHRYSIVDDQRRVREVAWKKYAYILPEHGILSEIEEEDFSQFVGTHDFRNFCKFDDKPTEREILSVTEERINGKRAMIFTAKGFLWNQIRFMVGYAIEKHLHPSSTPDNPFSEGYNARRLGPSDFLVLMQIKYENLTFTKINSRVKYNESLKLYYEGERQSFLGSGLMDNLRR